MISAKSTDLVDSAEIIKRRAADATENAMSARAKSSAAASREAG